MIALAASDGSRMSAVDAAVNAAGVEGILVERSR